MLLGEPPATQFDLHFAIAGIRVRVHPFFWLAGLILGSRGNGMQLLVWLIGLFVSILVHELGHSLMMRRFGVSSHIVLHMMGGLAIPDSQGFGRSSISDPQRWILISFAGPAAGFFFAAVIVLLILVTGGTFDFVPQQFPPWNFDLGIPLDQSSQPFYYLASVMLYINIFWGMINLLPVYPLDGGQIARQLMSVKDPWKGVTNSLWLSVFAGGAVAVLGLMFQETFIAILFGMLAVQSYMSIQQMGTGGFGGGRPW